VRDTEVPVLVTNLLTTVRSLHTLAGGLRENTDIASAALVVPGRRTSQGALSPHNRHYPPPPTPRKLFGLTATLVRDMRGSTS
jgi:hypothetical protein